MEIEYYEKGVAREKLDCDNLVNHLSHRAIINETMTRYCLASCQTVHHLSASPRILRNLLEPSAKVLWWGGQYPCLPTLPSHTLIYSHTPLGVNL